MGRFVKNPQATQGQTLEIPSVTTANRPAGQNGQIIFNLTTSTYQVYNGSQWYNVSEASREKTLVIDKFQGDGSTTVFGGGKGNVSPLNDFTNVIDFFIFSTIGDAINFGDLTVKSRQMAACSSPTRGVFAGGYNPTRINNIEFITFTSTGNAQDFGDLTVARSSFGGGSNATRGLFASGFDSPTNYNIIDYIEIATAGNAIDFGDTLQTGIHNTGTACSQTRALFAGGYLSPSPSSNIISYATISTTGDAADFGDLTVAGSVGNDGATSDVNGGIQ